MKNFHLSILVLLITITAHAQWQATNLTQYNYLAVAGLANYNGNLYSTVFNGLSADLYQLDPGNTSWTIQTISGVNEKPALLVTAGSNLYMTATNTTYGMLYRSNDASTFIADTVGLPKASNGIALPYGLQYFNGKVVINLGSNGYWIKDTSSVAWQFIDPATSLNGGIDPLCYSNDTIFAYDNSGTHTFYVSGNYGQTWSVRTTNLPSPFYGSVLAANKTTGRLYIAGAKIDGTLYGVYYSDDNGFTWTMANLTSFIGTDVNGGQQEVRTIYANGSKIYIALENDDANTTPDILSSTSSIVNMSYDTLGLVVDPAGSMYGRFFADYNGKIAVGLNLRDVFLNGASTTVNEISVKSSTIKLSPNPAVNTINITSKKEISIIKLLDITGKQIKQIAINNYTTTLNISDLNAGVYFVTIQQSENQETIKIIKQ